MVNTEANQDLFGQMFLDIDMKETRFKVNL